MVGVSVEPLRFRLGDIRDEHHTWIRFRIKFCDLWEIHADILGDPLFRQAVSEECAPGRLPVYLAKALVPGGHTPQTLWRILLLIQVCAWKVRREQMSGTAVLFLEQQPWFSAIARYAARHHVMTIPVAGSLNIRRWLRRHVSPELKRWLRFRLKGRRWRTTARFSRTTSQPCARARIAVDYYGAFNLRQPERHSDLFFWRQSSLSGRDLLLCFSLPQDPLDTEKLTQLNEHEIEAVALTPEAATVPEASTLTYRPRLWRKSWRERTRPCASGWSREARWLREQQSDYQALRDYWVGFFARYGIKIYVTWFKFDGVHCAIADALQGVGGVTALYQRVYDLHPTAHSVIAADVCFGFSPAAAEIERRSGSHIPYHVATGYLGDVRFALLRQRAARVREALQRQGAQRILAFADEGTSADSRWFHGHEFMRQDYTFLLEHVLEYPWFGLVLKPKIPSTLRRRLGPVAELLKRAEDTGRCVVYEDGILYSADSPAAAALAADALIHSFLVSGTAGMESALAGVPTLLLDREGWTRSPFYRLGVGRVVFPDLERAWNACVDHWTRPGGVPGFGDWSSMLDELDPFRDGRAAERMGTYLQWLLEGFKAGMERETVMADAAERYTTRWGKDKITHVNTEAPRRTGLVSVPEASAQAAGAAILSGVS